MFRFPSLFISHGAPTYALDPGKAGQHLRALGKELPRPRAVLVVSPHWRTASFSVTTSTAPETLHDFAGFPPALNTLCYPAPGHPELARAAARLLAAADQAVSTDDRRGLDHGAWVPLKHLFPAADVPVFQVSMPVRLSPEGAWRLGETLSPLAGHGVLIVGSGSLTHNLYEVHLDEASPAAYVLEFVDWVSAALMAGERRRLTEALAMAPHAARAHPTLEHFLPLLVAAGAAAPSAAVRVLPGGVAYGVLSMESYLFGEAAPPRGPGATSSGDIRS